MTGNQLIRLADYRPPDYLIDAVELVFEIFEDTILTRSTLSIRRNPQAGAVGPLRLDGERLHITSVAMNGGELEPTAYQVTDDALVIGSVPERFLLRLCTWSEVPDSTAVIGVGRSGDVVHTHCEPQGFRRLTYFLDRPDVLAPFMTTLIADPVHHPVLLANGNPAGHGTLVDGRHWARWHDPHPKPSYLFAFVAGALVAERDRVVTQSGRAVHVAVWSHDQDRDRRSCALAALIAAMRWDDEVNGLEYDLDALNVVALPTFSMGAMENKGLPIFEGSVVLTLPDCVTDQDRRDIETAIAHEYFHNWTGNRVTIRDWFQLVLKESLTVARTRAFTARRGSSAANRIDEIRAARGTASVATGLPMRPASYAAVTELFVEHIYDHGAEILRMVENLVGASAFHEAVALFLERHDGSSATIEDFLDVVAKVSSGDFDADSVLRWYDCERLPHLVVSEEYDARQRVHTVTLEQVGSEDPNVPPLAIPARVALLGPDGVELPARLEGGRETSVHEHALTVRSRCQSFRFADVPIPPVASIRETVATMEIRGRDPERLRFLSAKDRNPVARWDAWQQTALFVLRDLARAAGRGAPLPYDEGLEASLVDVLENAFDDPAYAAEMLVLPDVTTIADDASPLDVEAAHAARAFVRAELSRRIRPLLLTTYAAASETGGPGGTPGHRALRNACLGLLAAAPDDEVRELAQRQFDSATITEVVAALAALIELGGPECEAALASSFQRWKDEPKALDAWFALQARGSGTGTADGVTALARHPSFDLHKPERVNALVLTFATENPLRFHARDGSGYACLAARILEVDAVNPAVASRLAMPLTQWQQHDEGRQAAMRTALEDVLTTPGVSERVAGVARRGLDDRQDKALADECGASW